MGAAGAAGAGVAAAGAAAGLGASAGLDSCAIAKPQDRNRETTKVVFFMVGKGRGVEGRELDAPFP